MAGYNVKVIWFDVIIANRFIHLWNYYTLHHCVDVTCWIQEWFWRSLIHLLGQNIQLYVSNYLSGCFKEPDGSQLSVLKSTKNWSSSLNLETNSPSVLPAVRHLVVILMRHVSHLEKNCFYHLCNLTCLKYPESQLSYMLLFFCHALIIFIFPSSAW